MSGAGIAQAVTGDFDELRQQERVVLEKRIARHIPILRRNPEDDLESAFWGRMAANLFYLLVESWFGNWAFFDVHHQAVVRPDKADVQALFELVPLAANHDSIAVTV